MRVAVLAAFLVTSLLVLGSAGPSPLVHTVQAAESGDLDGKIMTHIHKMNADGHGIFNEDISAIVAPYFPIGISFAAAEDRARRENLRPLAPYRGHKGPGTGAMYVTTFDMMKGMASSVFVAVYLTFEPDATGQQVLKATAAYLRASDM